MPQKRFPFEFDKPARLEITWDGSLFNVKGNIIIKYDDATIGSFQNRIELENGIEFQLQNGSLLKIQLVSDNFEIFCNGHSSKEITEAQNLRVASYLLGISSLIAGCWAILEKPISPLGVIGYFGIGLGYLFNGIQVKKNYSLSSWGVILLCVIYSVIFNLVIPIQTNKIPDVLHLVVTVLLTIFLAVIVISLLFKKILKAKI